jgi:hypothetical protein
MNIALAGTLTAGACGGFNLATSATKRVDVYTLKGSGCAHSAPILLMRWCSRDTS